MDDYKEIAGLKECNNVNVYGHRLDIERYKEKEGIDAWT